MIDGTTVTMDILKVLPGNRNPSSVGVQRSIIKRIHYLEEKIDKLQQENESLKQALCSFKQIIEGLHDTINK